MSLLAKHGETHMIKLGLKPLGLRDVQVLDSDALKANKGWRKIERRSLAKRQELFAKGKVDPYLNPQHGRLQRKANEMHETRLENINLRRELRGKSKLGGSDEYNRDEQGRFAPK